VDTGSEPLQVLRRKVAAYENLRVRGRGLLGWDDFGLAFVLSGATSGRDAAIRRILSADWSGCWHVGRPAEVAAWSSSPALTGSPASPYSLPLLEGEGGARNS
jgi:hypothetical protein